MYSELLHREAKGRQTVEQAARAVLQRLPDDERDEIMLGLIEAEISELRRAAVRETEVRSAPIATRSNSETAAERQERYRREDFFAEEAQYASLGALMADYKSAVRLEITVELLRSTFALADGRTVTWGNATLADHRARTEMIGKQVAGSLETIARHNEAIRMIKKAKASRLADLAKVAA